MKKILLVLVGLLVGSAIAAPIRAVQLDLARQKETVPFVKEYMKRMSAAGYNTVVLYLEDRVKTASYPYPADAESYLPDEIREIVSAGTALGLDLVPVVSPLGHTERFLRHDALKKFGEQCEGRGRWGKTENPGCFCLTDPAARAWMETYIGEVVALFPGKNLHLGFDETWNLGYCTRCRPIFEKDGLGALYLRHVLWAHDLATRLGKRMWMWDDFFEYVPEQLEKVPRDVLMCCWNYDRNIERTGLRAHFGGRLRRDNLAIYERLGFECLVCPWFDYENVRTITEYAASRKAAGFFFTQWEMETDFHTIFYPRVLAGAALWNGAADLITGEWITKTLREVYPSLDADTLRLVEGLMFDQSKLKFTTVTVDSILNGVHENSKLRYWRTALARLQAQPSKPGCGNVPPDQFSEEAFIEDLTVRTEMAILCEETRNAARYLYLPDRTATQSESAKRELRRICDRWAVLVARRVAQWATWRPGIVSEKENKYRAHLPAVIDAALAKGDVAEASEWLFEIDLSMTDTHGCPQWTVEVRPKDGTGWTQIAAGTWKPKKGDHPYVAKLVPVTMKQTPVTLRLSCGGYGAGEACHVSLYNAKARLVPAKIISTSGEVRDAENLLVDDFRDCRLGLPDCANTFLHPEIADRKSAIELQLTPVSEQ